MSTPQDMQAELEDHRRRVDVDNYTITIRELINMSDSKELHRAPDYQRKFQWDPETESRLIESVLLGLPIPNIFVATNTDGSWEVVDGLQRLSTIMHFHAGSAEQLAEVGKSGPLTLTGLRQLTTFNEKRFTDLPPATQALFTKRGLGVTALSDKSDPSTRFDTFERLNRGSLALSQQEVRACVYEGPLNDLLRELAAYESFVALVKLQQKDENNATREELVLKYFAYKYGLDEYRGKVAQFLTDWMEANRNRNTADLRAEFQATSDALHSISNGPILKSNYHVTPLNEFEAVLVGAGRVLEQNGELRTPDSDWLDDPTLVDASTNGSNARPKLLLRISRATELLGGS